MQHKREKQRMSDVILLRLFITGETSRSQEAVVNFRRMMNRMPEGLVELEVIDVLERPEAAEQDGILATPTLVRSRPQPERRIIGDLRDSERVLRGLGIDMMIPTAEED